ncbi:MAG: DUF2318 domain-containing protein [Candidatus Aenigmarchaeota archaeon]|nr:DUF2318 domain-containing protein [Candidatus Aenigmarchaeota archaeon]
MNKIVILLAAIVLVAATVFTGGFGLFGPSGNAIAGGSYTIPLSDISGTAKFYEHQSGGTTITFFVVKASDGTIKTGFDACDVCYSTKKGYRQEGEYMVCNNCGNKYPIVELGTENKRPGGCWPGYLPSRIEGENIVIQNSDLEEGKWRF